MYPAHPSTNATVNGIALSITDNQTLKAYLIKESKEFGPTSVRHKCSILKKMTVVQGEPQPEILWKQLKGWMDNLERDYKPQKVMVI